MCNTIPRGHRDRAMAKVTRWYIWVSFESARSKENAYQTWTLFLYSPKLICKVEVYRSTYIHTDRQKGKHGQTKNTMPSIIWSRSIQNPQLINIQRHDWKHFEMLLFCQHNKVNPSFWLHLVSLIFSFKQKDSKWLKLTTPKGERTKTYLWSRSYRCLLTCFWKLKILEQKSKATFRFIQFTRSGQSREKQHKQICAMRYKDAMFGYTIK